MDFIFRVVEFSNEGDMSEAIRLFDDYDYNGSRISVKKDVDDSFQRDPPRRRTYFLSLS